MDRKYSKATLEKRLARLEENLQKEQERQHRVLETKDGDMPCVALRLACPSVEKMNSKKRLEKSKNN